MASLWCDINDVKEHLGDAENAKGYIDANVAEKIEGAEAYLAPYFTAQVTSATVATWLSKLTTPKAVQRLTAMLAAVYILQSYGGQSIEDETTKAGSLWSQIMTAITALQEGNYQLVDPSGGGAITTLPQSTTRFKTPSLSMGNEGDDSVGTLDDY